MSYVSRRLQVGLLNVSSGFKQLALVRGGQAVKREVRCYSLAQSSLPSYWRNSTRVNPILRTQLSPSIYRNISIGVALKTDAQIVKTPGFPESVAQGDLKWLKKVGDSVRVDEIVAEIETDKTMIPVPSPFNGVITELLASDSAKVAGHQPLFKVKVGDGTGATAQQEPAIQKPVVSQATPPAATPQPQASESTLHQSPPPAASAQPQVTVTSTTAPPPPSAPRAPAAAAPKAAPVSSGQKNVTPGVQRIFGTRGEHRVRMSRLRMRIAERLKEAQNTCAMLTTFNEVDMSSVLEMRKRHGEAFQKKHGFKLGIMGPFIKAAAYALDQMPIVNAVIDQQEIVYRDYVDISVAVSAPRGLVVPVIRGVESMNYVDIERAIAMLGEKARKETLTLEEMEGGTFTVSNGGVFGSLISSPIINLPQSAILGMHATFDRPVAINGKVEIRPMMYITLSYDHRLIDGREAVTFLRTIKTAVEDPRVLQLDL